MILVWAALSMAAKDAFGTLLVIAESRGKALLAGVLDAGGDLALVAVTVCGAGQVIEHGLDGQSIAVLAVIMATSFAGTMFWTHVGQRIK